MTIEVLGAACPLCDHCFPGAIEASVNELLNHLHREHPTETDLIRRAEMALIGAREDMEGLEAALLAKTAAAAVRSAKAYEKPVPDKET